MRPVQIGKREVARTSD